MAILVLVLNPERGEGGYIQLETSSYLIGRGEESDIELDCSSVSREHARIYRAGGEWHLEDLKSRNGSAVNGKRVDSAVLQEGDIVAIGPMAAFFFTESEPKDVEGLRQNFPRLKEMAVKYAGELVTAQKPLMAPSEKIPVVKSKAAGSGLGKSMTLLSDIASGKIRNKNPAN